MRYGCALKISKKILESNFKNVFCLESFTSKNSLSFIYEIEVNRSIFSIKIASKEIRSIMKTFVRFSTLFRFLNSKTNE